MTGFIMIIIFVLVATLCIRWLARYEGYYSIAFIFSLLAFAYGAGIPIELILRDESTVTVSSYFTLTGFTPDISWIIFTMSVLSIPFFCLGYVLSGFSALRPDNHNKAKFHKSLSDYMPYALMTIALISTLLITFRYQNVIQSASSSYHLSSELQYTNPIAFLLYYLVYVTIAILAAIIAVRHGHKGLIMAGLLWFAGIYMAFYSHERAPIALTSLSIGYVLFHKTKGKGWLAAGSAFAAMILLFVITPIFSLARSGEFELHEIIPQLISGYGISIRNLDPAGPVYSIVMYIKDSPPLELGSTYLSQLGVIIPKFIWPDRPVDLAENFAREYMANWTPGMGFGYSPYAEATLNFGPYFAPLHFLIVGLVWGLFWRAVKFFMEVNNSYERSKGPIISIPFDALYRVAGFYIILMFFRGTFVIMFKELLMILIPIFVFCCLLYAAKTLIPSRTTPNYGRYRPYP
jgi:hypothetical protein